MGQFGYGLDYWKKACCTLRPFHMRHYLYTGCPCIYGIGHAAHDVDDDDADDDDGIDEENDG